MLKNIKYIILVTIFFIFFILINSWQNEKNQLIPKIEEKNPVEKYKKKEIKNENIIIAETDLFLIKINKINGDIFYFEFKKYLNNINEKENLKLIENFEDTTFLVKSDIYSSVLENDINYKSENNYYIIKKSDSKLKIKLYHEIGNSIFICKVFILKNYSYDIETYFKIKNIGEKDFNCNIKNSIEKTIKSQNNNFFTTKIYENLATKTSKKKYKKLSLDKIKDKKFITNLIDGWIAYINNYFIVTIISQEDEKKYFLEKYDDIYKLNYENINEIIVKKDEVKKIKSKIFIGPKKKDFLNNLDSGLSLSIDYGFFWPIASALFMLLNEIQKLTNNWGLAIIIITILIKLLFFQMSSISYRSLGHMKKLQPKINILQEQYKNNKNELNQALLELYRKEKINPLSGCLPILIQIPVFISLYYVILESVELRHAPFYLWINDLSSKDPYYIFPILMCVTMFIQQKVNPPIQDPIQQKVMLIIPFVFLIICLQIPAGLVIYWVINNILSILQQLIIINKI